MIPPYLIVIAAAVAAVLSMGFSTLSYALRDFSRVRLESRLERLHRVALLDPVVNQAPDLIFLTAAARLFTNILVLICVLRLLAYTRWSLGGQYLLGVAIAGFVTLVMSVAIPNAAARHGGETLIALCARLLLAMRVVLLPVLQLMHLVDHLMRRATGPSTAPEPQEIEEEILAAVEESQAEGLVGEQEREMIQSVIELRATTAGQIMTARPEIVAIELPATLEDAKRTIEESAHSRIPVYEQSLDHVVGILYARDLLPYVGVASPQPLDLRSVLRPALFVPESKPVRDLLADFRQQKVHMAIVLDEYGGTAGLVTIEDVIEELVGDIADEHEPAEPAALRKVGERAWEADARVRIEELNRELKLSLPEDAGVETLGGLVSTTLGSIPAAGTSFEHSGVTYTVLDAEPQKINRVRLEVKGTSQ